MTSIEATAVLISYRDRNIILNLLHQFYQVKFYLKLLSFQREHNETLAKLNFVLALVDCILELARSRAAPITALRQGAAMRDSVSGG